MTSFSFFKYFDAFELDVKVVNFVYYGKTQLLQGGHILAEMKFPVFSLSFPCVTKIFPVLFLRKN